MTGGIIGNIGKFIRCLKENLVRRNEERGNVLFANVLTIDCILHHYSAREKELHLVHHRQLISNKMVYLSNELLQHWLVVIQ